MTRLLTAATLLFSCVSSAFAQTADEIVEKHLAALGGRETLSRIRTRVATATITVTTPVGDLLGVVEAIAKAPNKSRTLATIELPCGGELINDQRFDGINGYVINSLNGSRDITGSELDTLKNSGFPTPWLDYRERGHAMALVGKESLGGRPALVLEVTPKTGPKERFWLDAETYMLLKTSVTRDVPPNGVLEQITEFGDYRTIDGVTTPFLVKLINPVDTVTAVLTDVKHNVDLDESFFAKP